MLNQLARFRVHLIFSACILGWFLFGTFMRVIDGENVFWAFWSSVREVKLMEWVSAICIWIGIASLVKQNHELREKLNAQASRQ